MAIGNGSRLTISHIGSIILVAPTQSFFLNNVLRVPSIQKNLIYVFQFCKTNDGSIEFFFHFVWKNL